MYSQKSNPVLDKLSAMIQKKLSAKKAGMLVDFVQQHYANIPKEELLERDLVDWYAGILSHWSFLTKRQAGEVKLRVFNPSFESHGWQSSHTVIEISMDDHPFLVDSVTMELNRLGVNIHFIAHSGGLIIGRNAKGELTQVYPKAPNEDLPKQAVREAFIYVEVDRQADEGKMMQHITHNLERVIQDVVLVVGDFEPMRKELQQAITTLSSHHGNSEQDELQESIAFLSWLDEDHFTFLGYNELEWKGKKGAEEMVPRNQSCLGLLKHSTLLKQACFVETMPIARSSILCDKPLLISKANHLSTVHRPAKLDVVGIKQYNDKGELVGEKRFIGLFTSSAYHGNIRYIPFLRRKAALVLQKTQFSNDGHDAKALLNVLNAFPRDELFQIEQDELFEMALGIMHIQERQRIRLFIREDTYGRYCYCMVFVPKEIFNTDLRIKIQNILLRELHACDVTFSPHFLESVLCRIDYVVQVDCADQPMPKYDIQRIEAKLVEAARNWRDDLHTALIDLYGEHEGSVLFNQYQRAFPAGYREDFLPRSAAADIAHIEQVLSGSELGMQFYRMLEEPENRIRFKSFHKDTGLPLTDVLPLFENMGLKVIEERPYEIRSSSGASVWISDFGMELSGSVGNLDAVSDRFKEAFLRVWTGLAENDGFNQLVVSAGLPWREIMVLRAYAKYLLQIGFHYSQPYMEDTLQQYPEIAIQLVELFKARFSPALAKKGENKQAQMKIEKQIENSLNQVKNLDSDKILRHFCYVIQATIRTNYFQLDADGAEKSYISFKIDSAKVPDMPKPVPMVEIFVFSPRVEGIHLRCAPEARGGLRWSDRREDFRTEVLGLMKAQQVKNALIVPQGAKGGFVTKALPAEGGRDAVMAEVVSCYQQFIRGLLDITDNILNNKTVPPKLVVRYDGDDPYFVVAADKGTATFSDIANAVAAEYNFWLGDAFASGGSNGYDHKKMGITAKGAWESVKRHFMEIGHDIQKTPFSAVGIGDMSGDVFGNGMLLSKQLQLKAAFNHMHIFLDPNPDTAKSFAERKRLFALPRSTWADYDAKCISQGGGVFERNVKSIPLSPEVREFLRVKETQMEPNQLIQAILQADIDLLWNGGIGTYIKSSEEENFTVGDRSNDAVRVDAADINAKIIGEGGNLGVTQLGRIEYALRGGQINTDAIDNSAGVDCSDHEVNIKILLNDAIQKGDLTEKQRNALLEKMDDAVAELVLKNNYDQNQVLSNAITDDVRNVDIYIRLLRELDREAGLSREVEALPGDKDLKARQIAGNALSTPELGVIMAYVKNIIKQTLIEMKLTDDPYFERYLQAEFPAILREQFGQLMPQHRLAKQIVATQVTNTVVKYMGITFVHRLYDETGANPGEVIKAFEVVKIAFSVDTIWAGIEKLDGKVPAYIQHKMINMIRKALRRSVRWLLRNRRSGIDVEQCAQLFMPYIAQLRSLFPKLLGSTAWDAKKMVAQKYSSHGVPKALATKVAGFEFISPIFDIIEVSLEIDLPVEDVAEVYSGLNGALSFSWLRDCLGELVAEEGYWETLSLSALRDDLDKLQRILTKSVLQHTDMQLPVDDRIRLWADQYRYMVNRWLYTMDDLKASKHEFVKLLAALRCLLDLAQTSDVRMGKEVQLTL